VPATPAVAAAPAAAPGAPLLLTFAEPVYEISSGQEFEVGLLAENLPGVAEMPIEVMFNPQLLGFVRGEPGSPAPQSFKAEADGARGVLRLSLVYDPQAAPTGNATLARVTLRGAKSGVSYLVYRLPSLRTATGEAVTAQSRVARVLVK
jgi:hypothetical protein